MLGRDVLVFVFVVAKDQESLQTTGVKWKGIRGEKTATIESDFVDRWNLEIWIVGIFQKHVGFFGKIACVRFGFGIERQRGADCVLRSFFDLHFIGHDVMKFTEVLGRVLVVPNRRGNLARCFCAQDDQRSASNRTVATLARTCLLYTSPSPRDLSTSRMPSSA